MDERELILQTFSADVEENLGQLEEGLLALEQHPDDEACVQVLFRAAHSIKGDAALVGFEHLSELVHIVEDVLDRIRQHHEIVTGARISALLAAVDALRQLVAAALRGDDTAGAEQRAVIERLSDPAGVDVAAPAAQERTTRSLLRVSAERLDRMLTLSGELAVARRRMHGLLALGSASALLELRALHDDTELLFDELQRHILSTRMVSLGPMLRSQVRIVRDTALQLDKQVQITIAGDAVEIDSAMTDDLREALTHMVRNAVDHGIERPERRVAAGKSAVGSVHVHAKHEGGSVIIEVMDDGAGLDLERIRARAHALGIDAGALDDAKVCRLVLEPGFSTNEVVSTVSGRGVGLDVVRSRIEALRGAVSIATTRGRGTTVQLQLPLTLALIDGFYVRAGDETFVIPLDAVAECVDVGEAQAHAQMGSGVLNLRGEPVPYLRLRRLFGLGGTAARESVVVVRQQNQRAALVVDTLEGGAQAVLKPLGPLFRRVEGLFGSTITGDGRVALVLDIPALLRHAASSTRETPFMDRENADAQKH